MPGSLPDILERPASSRGRTIDFAAIDQILRDRPDLIPGLPAAPNLPNPPHFSPLEIMPRIFNAQHTRPPNPPSSVDQHSEAQRNLRNQQRFNELDTSTGAANGDTSDDDQWRRAALRALNSGGEDKKEEAIMEDRPPVVLVPVLIPTPYEEEKDGKHVRSLTYIRAQRNILAWLNCNAADKLTPMQAFRLTEHTHPDLTPSLEEALHYCYYMRSLGINTYSRIDLKKEVLQLFVADSTMNDASRDSMYWEQELGANGRIREMTSVSSNRRRHALANGMPSVPHSPPPRGPFERLPPIPEVPRPQELSPQQSELARAQRELDRLITDPDSDPDLIQATIEHVTDLTQRAN